MQIQLNIRVDKRNIFGTMNMQKAKKFFKKSRF